MALGAAGLFVIIQLVPFGRDHSNIAPTSWRILSGVESGRDELNYSEYDPNEGHFAESAESVKDGEMPQGDTCCCTPGRGWLQRNWN